MGFFQKKGRQGDRYEEDANIWKGRYLELLQTIGKLFPEDMDALLRRAGCDIHSEKERTAAIQQHLDYIDRNIQELTSWKSKGKDNEVTVPSVVLKRVKVLREMVNEWQRTKNGLPFFPLADYYPARTRTTTPEIWDTRNLVWHFKCNVEKTTPMQHAQAMEEVMERMLMVLERSFGKRLEQLTLVCIPASSTVANDVRYAEFAERICKRTGMTNSHGRIKIHGRKEPKHLGKSEGVQLELDKEWFRYRSVLFFDDIITTGSGYEFLAGLIRESKAFTVGAIFIAQTIVGDR